MRALSGGGRLFVSVVLGVSSLCSWPEAAWAEDAAKASVLAEAAAARVNQGDRRVAIDLYEEAYTAAPRREYLREIAGLYEALALAGDTRDVRLAILYYERFLVGEGPTSERTAIEARLTGLRGRKARMRSEPLPQIPERVPIALLAYNATQTYDVSLGNGRCFTPCTVVVPPGPAMLEAKGAGEMKLQFVVPTRPGQIRLHHSANGGFVAGAILVPVGIVTGASLWSLGFLCDSSECLVSNFIAWPVLGVSALITGIVLLATGRVTPPVDANRVELIGRGGAPRLRLTSVGLAPQPGGAAGGLRLEF
jgi:hypothetical protein